MPGFVIQYNKRTGARNVTEYLGSDGHRLALRERLRLERETNNPDIEIVSLVGRSLDTIKKTHSRYFMDDHNLLSA